MPMGNTNNFEAVARITMQTSQALRHLSKQMRRFDKLKDEAILAGTPLTEVQLQGFISGIDVAAINTMFNQAKSDWNNPDVIPVNTPE